LALWLIARGEEKFNPSRCLPHIIVKQTTKDREFQHPANGLGFVAIRDSLIYPLVRAF